MVHVSRGKRCWESLPLKPTTANIRHATKLREKYAPESPSAYSTTPNSSQTPNGLKKRSTAP
ncbi:Arm DNA-binding domain-containing protein [Neisseria sicca]|uniref:Arm DNA-binding domain-containing protein n=1 Tax=Neisseria sicca TaxID=490 RepID=UPI00195780C0